MSNSFNPKARKLVELFDTLSGKDQIYVLKCIFNDVAVDRNGQFVCYTEIFESDITSEEEEIND